jgi:hypothetical protein
VVSGAGAASELELGRLVREAAHRSDVARRSAAYMVEFGVSMLAFALAPLVPGGRSLFGALTTPVSLAIMSPGVAAACVSVVLFRRRGSEWGVYQACEVLESFLLYAVPLAMIFVSRTTWSVLWILPAFTVVFWANAKPFDSRIYLAILVVAHGALALAQLARGGADAPSAAWLAIEVGVACGFAHELLARRGRSTVRLEADRNVLRSELDAARLDGERDRVAGMLRERVGAALAALANELDPGALEERARSVMTEVQGVGAVSEDLPISLGDFAARRSLPSPLRRCRLRAIGGRRSGRDDRWRNRARARSRLTGARTKRGDPWRSAAGDGRGGGGCIRDVGHGP